MSGGYIPKWKCFYVYLHSWVAVCCGVVQCCGAAWCSVVQCVVAWCSEVQCGAACRCVLQIFEVSFGCAACRSLFAKEPLITVLFCGKRHMMSQMYEVSIGCAAGYIPK